MKKNLTYRDKLIDLAEIYNISEVRNYIRSKKVLTVGQLEHILKKNKVPIPAELNKSILEIQGKKFKKPFYSYSKNFLQTINNFFSSVIKIIFIIVKSVKNSVFNVINGFNNLCNFISVSTVNLLNGIYNFKVDVKKTNKIVTSVTGFVLVVVFIVSAATVLDRTKYSLKLETKKIESINKEKKTPNLVEKNESKKEQRIEKKVEKKENKKKLEKEKKIAKKDPIKKKEDNKVSELVLPDLNLKTKTVLSLFEEVEYDLTKVRFEKKVKPIYFTQFPKDLDKIQSVQLKKETFIKIILPLIVAENEKIYEDRFKLKRLRSKKMTTDKDKLWLRQKLREYKVQKGNGNMDELEKRMDIIPVSIALAQAAKESGWGTSRFALEGNAIFGQWTWNGKGIAPLSREIGKSHKILRFPILRASVKAYKNNLNTHKGYKKFREKRFNLRKKNKSIVGLDLIKTLDTYAQTGEEYTKILKKIIQQNDLIDFETVKLTGSVNKRELDL